MARWSRTEKSIKVKPGHLRVMLAGPRNVGSVLAVVSIWLGLSGFLAYAGYFAMYSTFGVYDDEGYWLIALRSYHLHGSLYHHTYAQAGPFYYEAWSLMYSLLGLTIDWDTGRAMTLVVWIATSFLLGIAAWVLSNRLLLGVLAAIVGYLVLFLLVGVSMEPAGLAHLLGVVVLLGLAVFVRGRRRVGIGIVGVASTALVFTKINIGLFIAAGLVAAVAICWPSQRWVTTRKLAVALALLMLPILLMAQVLNASWARNYCGLELMYLVGLLGIVLTRRAPVEAFSLRELTFGVVTVIGSALLIVVGVLVNGTSLAQLIHGAIFSQRGLAKIDSIPLPITEADVVVTAVSTVLALLIGLSIMKRRRRPRWLNTVGSGYMRFAIGVWILLTISVGVFPGWSPRGLVLVPTVVIPVPGQSFLLAAPFAWVAALGGDGSEDGAYSFARVAICLMSVLGCLEGFPVAGSQKLWAALTLVPVGVICITDGLLMISPADRKLRWAARGVLEVPLGSLVVMALTLFLALGNVGQVLATWRSAYNGNEPVRLLGADRVRLPPSEVQGIRTVTSFLKANCSTFWSLPGLNSFYFFSGERPPSGLNTSQQWWLLLDLNQQHQILTRLRETARLCVVEDFQFSNGSYGGVRVTQTPLVRYIEDDFVVVKTAGAYQLLVRPAPSTQG